MSTPNENPWGASSAPPAPHTGGAGDREPIAGATSGTPRIGGGGGVTPQITDRSYRGYDGPLHTRANRWWFVALATIRGSLRKPAFWIVVGIIFLVYVVNGLLLYFQRDFVEQMGGGAAIPGFETVYAETLHRCLNGSRLPLFLLALVVGAGSIAADNRANALLVYLSKPLTKIDYLAGKWAGIFTLLGAASLTPALLLYGFMLAAYAGDGFLKENSTLILRLLGATLFPALLHASLILGVSAWSKSPSMAGAAYAGVYLGLGVITLIAGGIMLANLPKGAKPDRARTGFTVLSLSPGGIIDGLGLHLYGVNPPDPSQGGPGGRRRRQRQAQAAGEDVPPLVLERPPLAPLLALAGVLVVVPVLAARARIRAVEVVTG